MTHDAGLFLSPLEPQAPTSLYIDVSGSYVFLGLAGCFWVQLGPPLLSVGYPKSPSGRPSGQGSSQASLMEFQGGQGRARPGFL
jgi:hypothetical protein